MYEVAIEKFFEAKGENGEIVFYPSKFFNTFDEAEEFCSEAELEGYDCEIFEVIDEFEKSEIKENRYKNTVDYYQYYLLWAIVLFLIYILIKSTFLNNIIKD